MSPNTVCDRSLVNVRPHSRHKRSPDVAATPYRIFSEATAKRRQQLVVGRLPVLWLDSRNFDCWRESATFGVGRAETWYGSLVECWNRVQSLTVLRDLLGPLHNFSSRMICARPYRSRPVVAANQSSVQSISVGELEVSGPKT